jgi:CubicO group peptidase (beta-lactamase class C family)
VVVGLLNIRIKGKKEEMKTLFRYWVLIVLTIALVVAIFFYCSYSGQDILTSKMEQATPQLMKQYKVPGAALVLVRNGEVVWSQGYGLADKARGIPVTDDTVFQAASISKAVTSWGVMRLVENGQLDLDAPVEQYLTRWHLPPSRFDASGVTIRRLLSHSAGLSAFGYPGLSPDLALPSLEESLSGNNGGAGEVQIVMEPGTQYGYSGGNFTLLQLIIEEITGETFSAYMQREVLDPLGMSHSSFEWRADLRPATAVAYSASGSPLPNYLFTEQAAAGLYTTAPDLARFVAAEMPGPEGKPAGRGVLAHDTLALMFKPVIKIQTGMGEGLGQSVSSLPDGSKVIQHGGDNKGWKATIMANPQWGVGIVVLTNSDNGLGLIGDVVWGKLLPLLIIERVLLMLIFALTVVILVDAIVIVRRWIKAQNRVV